MSILNAITAGAGGVALSGDTSGNLTIQSAGTNVASFLSTGNMQLNASNGGIIFNKSGGLNNQTLNDYEYGTWTPTDVSGGGLTLSIAQADYVKIGQLVLATAYITYPTTADGNLSSIGGLPYAVNSSDIAYGVIRSSYTGKGQLIAQTNGNQTYLTIYGNGGTTQPTNANLNNVYFLFSIVYRATS